MSMQSFHVLSDGTKKPVKNLGWLLRHYGDVTHFVVTRYKGPQSLVDAFLVAHLRDGGRYETPYASATILQGLLNRAHAARGLPISWFGKKAVVGKIPDPPKRVRKP